MFGALCRPGFRFINSDEQATFKFATHNFRNNIDLDMLEKLRNFLNKSTQTESSDDKFDASDKQLAQAALMFHVIAADGIVQPEEKDKLRQILESSYQLTSSEADLLIEEARLADNEAIDLYGFTRLLKRQLNEEERLVLVKNLWEMVYADGELHELEDNVVWRIAELLAIEKRQRMTIKRNVVANMQSESDQH